MASEVMVEEAPERVVRRSVVVDAPAAAVFDLLADPSRHHEIDGSGTVRDAASSAPQRLSQGARFQMGMKWFVPYRMTNEVVEFVEDETVAWRHMGGHIWRYTVQSLDAERCKVTEEFDWRPSRAPLLLKVMGAPTDNAKAIEQTLVRLAAAFAK